MSRGGGPEVYSYYMSQKGTLRFWTPRLRRRLTIIVRSKIKKRYTRLVIILTKMRPAGWLSSSQSTTQTRSAVVVALASLPSLSQTETAAQRGLLQSSTEGSSNGELSSEHTRSTDSEQSRPSSEPPRIGE